MLTLEITELWTLIFDVEYCFFSFIWIKVFKIFCHRPKSITRIQIDGIHLMGLFLLIFFVFRLGFRLSEKRIIHHLSNKMQVVSIFIGKWSEKKYSKFKQFLFQRVQVEFYDWIFFLKMNCPKFQFGKIVKWMCFIANNIIGMVIVIFYRPIEEKKL